MSAFNTYILSSSSLTVVPSLLILVLPIQMHLCPELIFQYQFHKDSSSPFSCDISFVCFPPPPSFSVLSLGKRLNYCLYIKSSQHCLRVQPAFIQMAESVWSPGIFLPYLAVRLNPRTAKAYIRDNFLNLFLSVLISATKECQQSLGNSKEHDLRIGLKLFITLNLNWNQIKPESCHFPVRKGIYLMFHLFFVRIDVFLTYDVLSCS